MSRRSRTHGPLVITLLASLGACGPGSVGDTNSSGSSSESTTQGSSSETSTNPETSTTSSETAPGTETQDECDVDSLDWCDDGDFGDATCDVWQQDCPENEKCVPSGVDFSQYKCVPVTGAQGPGESCMTDGFEGANDDCDATGFCFGYDAEQLGGQCYPFCTGNHDMPACIDGWQCKIPAQGPALCVESCTPLAGDCSPGSECAWTNSEFSCVPEGMASGMGEGCMFINDCAEDLICLGAEALEGCVDAGCCGTYCNLLAGDGPCQLISPSYVCEPFFEEAPPGLEDLGVCVLSQ